jgi:DNA modification methylase
MTTYERIQGFLWDFEYIARQSYRVLKQGGVMVWVVGDQVVDGGETLTSFEQALFFKNGAGFKAHDTMVYQKNGSSFPEKTRYWQEFEYMFVLSKGSPKTSNLITEPCRWAGHSSFGKKSQRGKNGKLETYGAQVVSEVKPLGNVWKINGGYGYSAEDEIAYEHPAIFPESLAERHILTWSNPGDVCLDFFGGSGTTAKMARKHGRRWMYCDISPVYAALAEKRLSVPYSVDMFAALAATG